MQVLAALLLALLLCGQPGRGRAQDEEDDGEDFRMDSYDDDEDDEDLEAGVMADREPPRCYSCQALHSGEGCGQVQSCARSQPVCKTLISHGDTGSGPLTTYSGWCADACQPLSKSVENTLMTVTCCRTALCNVPPWQDSQGSGAGSPRGPGTRATALLLSLLPGLLGAGP